MVKLSKEIGSSVERAFASKQKVAGLSPARFPFKLKGLVTKKQIVLFMSLVLDDSSAPARKKGNKC